MEKTAGEIFEEIVDLVRDAETRALFGERLTALHVIMQTNELYAEFGPFLTSLPDAKWLAVRIAIIARNLCAEFTNDEE